MRTVEEVLAEAVDMERDFADEAEARAWVREYTDDACVDNDRIAFLDDPAGLEAYGVALADGCCGFEDVRVTIAGRPAIVGCNYGH